MSGFAEGPAVLGRSPTEEEWVQLITHLDRNIFRSVASVIETNKDEFVAAFYATLLENPEAAPFLSHQIVNERLSHSMREWLIRLFRDQPKDVAAFAAEQRKIGAVHARIQVPIHVVMQGARLLKTRIARRLVDAELDREALGHALIYVDSVIDMAIELMGAAFVKDTKKGAQADEAYRIFSLGQDISLERESQRAALMEWSQTVLFGLYGNAVDAPLPMVGCSDFGLWLNHKAGIMFHGAPTLERIMDAMRRIDQVLLPALGRARNNDNAEMPRHLEDLQAQIGVIKYLLSELFQSVAAMENGRDPLTRTLNRRFLPSIIGREVTLASRDGVSFSVLMIDVDHFKQVNDRFGHAAGDTVLQQVAEIILDSCRVSDFVFRYGGEEFLVALVETEAGKALEVAERIREQMERKEVRSADGQHLRITLSVGVATFNGHPDYTYLVNAADKALYRAKREGRNRCVVSASIEA